MNRRYEYWQLHLRDIETSCSFAFVRACLFNLHSCFTREQMLLLRQNREHNVTYTITQR